MCKKKILIPLVVIFFGGLLFLAIREGIKGVFLAEIEENQKGTKIADLHEGHDEKGKSQTVSKKMISTRYRALGYNILENYGKGPPHQDLELVKRSMEVYRSLVRNQPRMLPPATSNAIFVRSLTGQNKEGLQIISPDSQFINQDGELTDRWGTPLVLHYVSSQSIGIRSAGPDRTLRTADDVVLPAEEKIMLGPSQ